MKSLLRALCVALGITTLCLLWIVSPLVSPRHLAVYHWDASAASLFIPTILDFCLFWSIVTALLLLSHRSRSLRILLWSSLLFFSPWIALKNWALISKKPLSHQFSLAVVDVSLGALLLVLVFWRPAFLPVFEGIQGFIIILLNFVAVSGALMLCEALWFAWQARSINAKYFPHQPSIAVSPVKFQSPRQRIIWIVLDELSYQQVFEQRFPGLQLPAFDQLSTESTVFTHVIPAGILTEEVLPSLITGLPVDDIRSSSGGRLSTHNPEADIWQPFEPHDTVFQDARNAGYHTAIAGWYNPYCRILPDVLDNCFWTFSDPSPTGLLPGQSISENMLQPLQFWFKSGYWEIYHLMHEIRQTPRASAPVVQVHILDYIRISAASDRLLQDPSCNFILLHIPAPHPQGIYNRVTAKFDTHGTSYIDNLALADRYLAHVRSLLQQKGQWDSSSIVVMGDHSWRTKLMWSHENWTASEMFASHGTVRRPAWLHRQNASSTSSRTSRHALRGSENSQPPRRLIDPPAQIL